MIKHKPKIPPGINPKKIKSEAESRKNIIEEAKFCGCHEAVLKAFARYDRMLTQCKNEEERKAIAIMGTAELYRIMNAKGGLSVDGIDIIPAEAENKA